jgi:succinate dehydrogenase / fumarate reductase cytochrome b subunit
MRLVDALQYRLPLAGVVSILHRGSGLLMFALLPLIIWLFDKSVTSEISYAEFTGAFAAGLWIFPGWFFKVVVLALIWAYLHHFIAGLRHIWMDMFHTVSKEQGKNSAIFTLAASLLLTVVFGYMLFRS